MLSRYGYLEDAWQMVTKREAPSWGYWVDTQGYTTLAETWTLSPEFRDASLNHVFMGDVAAWMCRTLAGLCVEECSAGMERVVIRPQVPTGLDSAQGWYDSVRGRISSEWYRSTDGVVHLTVQIPCGCVGVVDLGSRVEEVEGGLHRFEWNP